MALENSGSVCNLCLTRHRFDRKTWESEIEIFEAVTKATEEAFGLNLSIENRESEIWLVAERNQNQSAQSDGKSEPLEPLR